MGCLNPAYSFAIFRYSQFRSTSTSNIRLWCDLPLAQPQEMAARVPGFSFCTTPDPSFSDWRERWPITRSLHSRRAGNCAPSPNISCVGLPVQKSIRYWYRPRHNNVEIKGLNTTCKLAGGTKTVHCSTRSSGHEFTPPPPARICAALHLSHARPASCRCRAGAGGRCPRRC